jgi:hypothetical protein
VYNTHYVREQLVTCVKDLSWHPDISSRLILKLIQKKLQTTFFGIAKGKINFARIESSDYTTLKYAPIGVAQQAFSANPKSN